MTTQRNRKSAQYSLRAAGYYHVFHMSLSTKRKVYVSLVILMRLMTCEVTRIARRHNFLHVHGSLPCFVKLLESGFELFLLTIEACEQNNDQNNNK